jgi:Flp pilus assembly protein TadD
MRPNDVNGYHLRLLAYGKLLLRPKQVADAKTIIRLQPHSANAFNDLGIALGNAGKYHQSEQAFIQAIKLQPKNDGYYTNLAMVENLDKKPNLALQDLYRARSVATNPRTKEEINLAIKNLKKHMRG